jgi:hypothetical protein
MAAEIHSVHVMHAQSKSPTRKSSRSRSRSRSRSPKRRLGSPAKSQQKGVRRRGDGFGDTLIKACDEYDKGYEEKSTALRFPIVLAATGEIERDDASDLCFYVGCHGRNFAGIPELCEFLGVESVRYRTGMIDDTHYVKIAHASDGPINSVGTELCMRYHTAKKFKRSMPPIRGTVVLFPFKNFEALSPL